MRPRYHWCCRAAAWSPVWRPQNDGRALAAATTVQWQRDRARPVSMAEAYGDWEPVIGLEIHAQLLTRTKLFCGCQTSFGDEPNIHTCPVCLGLPGALPVLNGEALRLALLASLSLGCQVNQVSIFARKNYFYPDLPKGYQISQYEQPLAVAGSLEIEGDLGVRTVGITRVHMEEDAGKNMHGMAGMSLVDLNRAGTPLIEIVGEPDLRSPAEARAYMKRVHETLMFAGVNDGNLDQGSFRCDANVSVHKRGEPYGTRVEMKNINSFRFVEEALQVEILRQIQMIERGERLTQQTRGYNADKHESYLLRAKEDDAGYRYFPEPDLPPLLVDDARVAALLANLCETPAARRKRYTAKLGLTDYAAGVMTGHPLIAELFDRVILAGVEPTQAANFIQSEVLRDVTTSGLEATIPVGAAQLAELLGLVTAGSISGKQAKQVYSAMKGTDRSAAEIVDTLGMKVIGDEDTLRAMVVELISKHPKQAESYRAGKHALLGFFVGQLMKATGGSANPQLASELILQELS